MTRPSLRLLLGRALRLRCPNCGAPGLFESWFRPRPACPVCGQPLERSEEGYYVGALLLNLVIAEVVPAVLILGVALATWPDPPWGLLLYGGAALALAAPFAFYPFSKTLWLAIDLYIQPQSPEGTARPGDGGSGPKSRASG